MGSAAEDKDSVSIWFVREALAGLARRGGDAQGCLAAAGIPPSLVQSDQSRVSATCFGALWLAIAAALDDELFGMDARRMKVGSFALLCRGAVMGGTLRQALELIVPFFNVIMDDASVALEEKPAGAVLSVTERSLVERPQAYRVFAHETVLIMLHGLMCWLIGRRIALRRAAFCWPRPPWWREYLSMYSPELSFDAPATVVRFSAHHLDAPVVQDEASTREFLREAPHNFIVKYKDRRSCAARVRQRLRSAPPATWPSFATLAVEFGIAPSTLHRRLEQEGATFREIRDALRRDLAIDRLTHSEASIADVASDLGFAEPSGFHRAFKLWTGVRPGDYRRTNQGRAEP